MKAGITWNGKFNFTGTTDSGHTLTLDTLKSIGGEENGFRPLELLLIGLAGCTGMDVISILEKKKQEVSGFEVDAYATQAEEHPRVFNKITIEYVIRGKKIDPTAVERAIELSATKYCPAQAMLGKAVEIETQYKIVQED